MATIFLMFVLITIPIQRIIAFNCNSADYETIMDCDQCIKCGGYWCVSPGPNEPHCSKLSFGETRCTTYNEKEIFPFFPQRTHDDNKTSLIRLKYYEDSMKVSDGQRNNEFSTPIKANIDVTPIGYLGSAPDVNWKKKRCEKDTCVQNLVITLDSDFCSDSGGPVQHFVVPFKIENVTHAKAEYSVPCACQCSKNVSVNDAYCNGRGNLTCGVCTCAEDWTGARCDMKKPYDDREYVEPESDGTCSSVRGDVSCIHEMRPDVDCSGNGRCEDCCICDKTKDGWQYFDWNNYCEDLCMTTSESLDKDENATSVHFITYNETVSKKRDSKHRNIWVKCEETINDCKWTYYTRKNVKNEIAVMISEKSCPNAEAVVGGVNVTALVVPLVVAAALAMAGVGYYVWQSKGGAPQLSKANYQGLDGPKTRVETNPVYIEPIKSYKNPTYGQQV